MTESAVRTDVLVYEEGTGDSYAQGDVAILLHVPHASTHIPHRVRRHIVLSDEDLMRERLHLTDWYIDELFGNTFPMVRSPHSRLVFDVERFRSNDDEIMAAKGMGAIYTRTSDGRPLRSERLQEELLAAFYDPYHTALSALVGRLLDERRQVLLIDAHSFPSEPLPCDISQEPQRPDICIGTCDVHTPEELWQISRAYCNAVGWSVQRNEPYAGTFVPLEYYRKETRLHSIMIEVNRSLYMDETAGVRSDGFASVKKGLYGLLCGLVAFYTA